MDSSKTLSGISRYMEDSTINNPINQVFIFVKEYFTKILGCLGSFTNVDFSLFILESTISKLLIITGNGVSDKDFEAMFIRTLNAEICRTISSLRKIGAFQIHEDAKPGDDCGRFISKHTARKISNEKKRLAPDYVNYLKPGSGNITRKIEDSIDFDSLWTRILEKQINLKAASYVRKSRRRIVLAIVVSAFIVSFFGAAYIGSYRALTDGDITYGIAVKRLLSGIPLVFNKEGPEPQYLVRTGYQTKEQLLIEHPGAFILLPPYIPEGYSATEFAYMTHTDGFTTAIVYNVTEFAFFTIEYAVRNEYDPFSYRILYYEYEIVNEGKVSYYLFKESNYGFTAAFFLDDIYVTIKGQKNYPGTDRANITSMISGIMSEYYGTVTD
ncbi:MAG: hypothetical protein JXN10_06755 [Clostridia bacterium]|nr:hypothetical protein [Clostridia bacterium]MBN2883211.1 hypothetical protein [Clostridia bacterium]